MNKIPLTPKEETNEDKSYMLINTSDLSKKSINLCLNQ